MTRTVEGVVAQVIGYNDRDEFLLPPEVYDGLEPGEDLVVVLQEPYSRRTRRILGFLPVDLALRLTVGVVEAILGRPLLDQDPILVAVPAGTLAESERVELVVAEAVVSSTTSRNGTDDREVHLFETVQSEAIDG